MKKTKALALFLAALLLLGATPLLSLFAGAEAGSSQGKEGILFSSSFEENDPAVKTSVSDQGYFSNLKEIVLSEALAGEITSLVDKSSIGGSADYKSEESKEKLFDMSAQTKFLTSKRPSASDPVEVTFAFSSPQTVKVYQLVSANDENERDPKSWILYGSSDGSTYTPMDSRQNQQFSDRNQAKSYTVSDPQPYRYYRLSITENRGGGMTQLADFRMGAGVDASARPGDSPLTSETGAGPASSWAGSGAFDGKKALSVYAKQEDTKNTYARNHLYSGLSLKVDGNTVMSYVHFPSIAYGYDYEDTASYMIFDLKFSDGTYLSGLGAREMNGYVYTPQTIGDANLIMANQWNYIEVPLGDVAAGKTVTDIYVSFGKNATSRAVSFLAYFDDLVIENKNDPNYTHLSDYVDTRRGTNNTTSFSRGLTVPFINRPNGFNMMAPVTVPGNNQCYNYFDDSIRQFTITHVPSTWVGDYGTWQFMANTSVNTSDISKVSSSAIAANNLGASFSHDNEVAHAHYYSVRFDEGSRASGVKVEMTPTLHGAMVRFTFPKNAANANVIFDCFRADGSLKLNADGSFSAVSRHTNNGSANLQVVGSFDVAPESVRTVGKQGIVRFPSGTTQVTMKLSTSFLSEKQARHSMELEMPAGATFDSVFAEAQKEWDGICSVIEVEGATRAQKTTLYSCLYRAYSYPTLYSENTGTNEAPQWVYASPYQGTHRQVAGKLYVNNGFWDTYRTAWAAYALLTPSRDSELLNGILTHYKENKWIPRWVAPGGADSMLGTSSDIIFADAYAKGVKFDYETAFETMLKNALTASGDTRNGGRAENNTAVFTGYVSSNTQYGFSWTMEDLISDYCIAVMADYLGKTDQAEYFYNRAGMYVNMFNKSQRFFMGKKADGSWTGGSGYNPAGWWGDYSETNGWTMAFVPVYDGVGVANLYGGKKALLQKLNQYFDSSVAAMKKVSEGSIHEMVEAREVRMGQYSHSNQPAHAIPYFFAYADAPYRTQEVVREVMARLYVGSEIGQGYLGDEDNGEMSAWFILSSLGLYPQTMGSGQYVIGSPLFQKATVHMENGRDLVIVAENNSPDNIYIQSMTLNGKAYNKCFVDHADIALGGEIVFVMGDKPSDWGKDSDPKSLTTGSQAPVPAEDLVTSRTPLKTGVPTETLTNSVFTDISGASALFDNDSATAVAVTDGATVTLTQRSAARVQLITLSSAATGKAPSGFLLEGSADGKTWVTLDERSDLKFNGAQSTLVFAVPDGVFGNYCAYRLTLKGSGAMRLSEIEFLALPASGEAGTLSQKPAAPALARLPGEAPVTPPDDPTVPDTSAPGTDDPGVPGTDAPGTDAPSGTGSSPLGWIIGIALAAVVAGGAAAVFLLVFRKTKK